MEDALTLNRSPSEWAVIFEENWRKATPDQKDLFGTIASTWRNIDIQAPPGCGKTWFIGNLLYPSIISGRIIHFMLTPLLGGLIKAASNVYSLDQLPDAILDYLGPDDRDFSEALLLVATTGAAADPYSHLRLARTIHSAFGIGFNDRSQSSRAEEERMENEFRLKAIASAVEEATQYHNALKSTAGSVPPNTIGYDCVGRRVYLASILHIEEVSMLSPFLFRCIDDICTAVRVIKFQDDDGAVGTRPFGGLRLTVGGDELQMPPVKSRRWFSDPAASDARMKWMHLSLSSNIRQTGDPYFARINDEVRVLRKGTSLAESSISRLAAQDRLVDDQRVARLLTDAREARERPPIYVCADNATKDFVNQHADRDVDERRFPVRIFRPTFFLQLEIPGRCEMEPTRYYTTQVVDDVHTADTPYHYLSRGARSSSAAAPHSDVKRDASAFLDKAIGFPSSPENAICDSSAYVPEEGPSSPPTDASATVTTISNVDIDGTRRSVAVQQLTGEDRRLIKQACMQLERRFTTRTKIGTPVMCPINRLTEGIGAGVGAVPRGSPQCSGRATRKRRPMPRGGAGGRGVAAYRRLRGRQRTRRTPRGQKRILGGHRGHGPQCIRIGAPALGAPSGQSDEPLRPSRGG